MPGWRKNGARTFSTRLAAIFIEDVFFSCSRESTGPSLHICIACLYLTILHPCCSSLHSGLPSVWAREGEPSHFVENPLLLTHFPQPRQCSRTDTEKQTCSYSSQENLRAAERHPTGNLTKEKLLGSRARSLAFSFFLFLSLSFFHSFFLSLQHRHLYPFVAISSQRRNMVMCVCPTL